MPNSSYKIIKPVLDTPHKLGEIDNSIIVDFYFGDVSREDLAAKYTLTTEEIENILQRCKKGKYFEIN